MSYRYTRKLLNVNPHEGRFLTVSIPADLTEMFNSDWCVIERLPDNMPGIVVRPADVIPKKS
jgi:hypothetical protein